MDIFSALNIYGSVVVTLMMVFYGLESRSSVFTVLFGIMCMATSVYGFLAGTWPFGVIEAVWAAVAIRKYIRAEQPPPVRSS